LICDQVNIKIYPTLKLYLGSSDGQSQAANGIEINTFHVNSIVNKIEQLKQSQTSVCINKMNINDDFKLISFLFGFIFV